MRRRSALRFPSYRNLCVYHELAYERRTQTAVAAELGVSQRRVSSIGQQVRDWVDCLVQPRHYPGHAGMRFHLAIAQERIRLRDAYEPLVGMFTGEGGEPRYLRRYVTVVGGEALHTIEVSDRPDFRLLNQAVSVQVRQAELEAIANRGPFADLPSQVRQTVVHRAEPAPVNRRAHAASSSNASEGPSNVAANHTMDASNAASNCARRPSNPRQNQGGGVLT